MAEMFSILCLVIVVGQFISISAKDYCNLESCKKTGRIHTMCKYTSPQPAARCTQWTNQGLSNAEKKFIVTKHNQLRQKVASGRETRGNPGPQPAAVNMPDLKWDDELEVIAQRWADQCEFKHDKCRNVDRFRVGQNIALQSWSGHRFSSSNSKINLEEMIQSWYDEVAMFNRNHVSKFQPGMNTGHYTQIVWAETVVIGCGRILYKKSNGSTIYYLVCNYGPSGNWVGKKIYEVKQ